MAPLSSLAGALTKKAHTLEWFQFFFPFLFPMSGCFANPLCYNLLSCAVLYELLYASNTIFFTSFAF
jgi:hypothetical protein